MTQALREIQTGRFAEAEQLLRTLAAADPRNANALNLLGVVACHTQQYDTAIDMLQRAIKIDQKTPSFHNNLGLTLMGCGKYEGAIAAFRHALALRSDNSETLCNLGIALHAFGHFDQATVSLRRAIALDPGNFKAHNTLGGVFAAENRSDEAIACYRRAIELKPNFASAHNNLAVALTECGKFDEAIACCRRAIEIDPVKAKFRSNHGCTLLLMGAFDHGWQQYEYRFGPGAGVARRVFPQRYWEGQNIGGHRVLVWMEQGIGDELLFASMLPDLLQRSATVVVECAPKLLALFKRSFPDALMVARTDPPDPRTLLDIDYQVAAGSLGRFFRSTLESFPSKHGYLTAHMGRVAYWRQRLDKLGTGLKVGFSWRSNNLFGIRAQSCTRIEQWGPIFAVNGVHFVSLQYDECTEELARGRAQFGVSLHTFPEVDLFDDIDEAAALTKALDLVISAPTAVSVLSGALGVETWQMSYGPDWKTFGSGRDPWHPSITRFERSPNQTWEEIIEGVARCLKHASTNNTNTQ